MHKIDNRDGMRIFQIHQMQARSDKRGRPIVGKSFDPPLEIMHASDIAEYYGLDIRDVWPLVHENLMGQRVPYNTGETKQDSHTERHWVTELDDHNQPQQVEAVREVPITMDIDDGMYMRLKDVLYYAKAKSWTKDGGLPVSAAQAAASSDIAQLVEIVKVLLTKEQMAVITEPKPKRTLTPEHLEKMRLAREAKKVAVNE